MSPEVRKKKVLARTGRRQDMRKAAKILLKIINSVPPMKQEGVLAAELERIIRCAVNGTLDNLTALMEAYDKAHPRA